MTAAAQQRSERNAGLVLVAAAAIALAVANSPAAACWHHMLETPFATLPGGKRLTAHFLVADGLMAIFFMLVGLEVKREWLEGQLASAAQRRLPVIAATAGMAVPALLYLLATGFDPALARGWAIPAATDIAFVVGLLALLGNRAPPALRLLLVTLAIVDDIGAVAIIALFYTADLNLFAIGGAIALTLAMAALGQFGVRRLSPFLAGFALLWLLVLMSGVHATIAGVLAALTIPLGRGERHSPLKHLEHAIHPWVMFGVVPLFALVSAGVTVTGAAEFVRPVPLAIVAGLFLGKQLGIFGAIVAAVRLGVAERPKGTSWRQLYGGAILCGIGFTMSLFIGALAFPGDAGRIDAARLGTLAGSLLSAMAGYLVLRFTAPTRTRAVDEEGDDLFAAGHHD